MKVEEEIDIINYKIRKGQATAQDMCRLDWLLVLFDKEKSEEIFEWEQS